MTNPDVEQYKIWDLNTTMMWIKSLEDGRFANYCEVSRKGFESEDICAKALLNINPRIYGQEMFGKTFQVIGTQRNGEGG